MTNQPIIQPPDGRGSGRAVWVDGYLPSPYPEPQQPAFSMVDATWLRGALFRQRWVIGVTLLAAMLVGVVATLLATPIYEARSTVRISPFGSTWVVQGQEATAPVKTTAELRAYLQTQRKIVESRKLAGVVAANLEPATLNTLLGPEVEEKRPADHNDAQWTAEKQEMAVGVLQSRVSATLPLNELVVEIVFSSKDAAVAAEAADAYAMAYVQSDTQRAIEGNSYATQFLLEQIETVRGQLGDAEKAANAYARNSGIVTPAIVGMDSGAGVTITGANLSSINTTVAEATAKRIAAEQRWRAVQNLPAQQLPEVQSNGTIQLLTAEKASLNGELQNLRERYNDQFPEIVDIKSRIDLIDEQMATTASDIKAGIRNEFVIAQRQESALTEELGSATDEALIEQDEKIEYTNLERTAQALREQLNELLTRYNQIRTAANIQSGALTLLDGAVVPKSPVSPSLTRNLILAFVLGLGLAGSLALVREVFVDQFHRAEDLEDRLGVPVLGLTPFINAEDMEGQAASQFGSQVEAYASIRSTIDFALPRDGAVLQLTSSQAGEGKSTTSLILAELFARLGRRTLLIDCDLRKPSVVPLLGIQPSKEGITEVLLGQVSLNEALIEGVHQNLHILSVAETPSNPVELLSSERFRDFLKEARETYSIILIDSSPVLGLADAPEIAQAVDATVFVVEANRTSFAQARTAIQRLQRVGAEITGSILTKYRALEAGADYHYQYRYYQYGSDRRG